MPKITTDEYLAQLAEGAKASPHMQSIQRWLGERDIGDVFSPSAMGLSKIEYIKKLAAINAPGQEYVGKIARKLLKPIKEVGLMKDIVGLEPNRYSGLKDRARIWLWHTDIPASIQSSHPDKMSLIKEQLKGVGDIGMNPETVRPLTAVHEPAHILEKVLTPDEWRGLRKAYINHNMRELERYTGVSMHNERELLAEAYAQYIGGGSHDITFKEFPPFVKHLIKKYHKLLR